MKFLIDNQLPITLAEFIRGKGFECKHVIELSLDRATDQEIWSRAGKESWIVISKDEDFFYLAKKAPKSGKLLWVRIGNCRSGVLISAFERLWLTIEEAFSADEDVVEMR